MSVPRAPVVRQMLEAMMRVLVKQRVLQPSVTQTNMLGTMSVGLAQLERQMMPAMMRATP
jgi:hypothetical protein